jgi:DNA-binding protein YbaB
VDSEQRLRRLQQEAAALIRRPAAATGADGTGMVEVRVDDAGRLSQVDIHREWGYRIGDESLGRAVLAAFADAGSRRATEWAEAVQRPAVVGRAETDAAPPRRRPERPLAGFEERAATLRELTDLMDGALAEIDTLTDRLETLAQRTVEASSATGRVTVRLTGAQLIEVDITQRWLRLAPTGREIADEIEAACRRAYEIEAELAADAAAQAPRTAAVRALARDPQEFVRRLGLG